MWIVGISRTRAPLIWAEQPLRSLLFVPGSEPRKVAKAALCESDAVVLDLEDAVSENAKDKARLLVADAVAATPFTGILAVRINGPETGLLDEDLTAVFHPNLDCVVLPKVTDASYLESVHARLSEIEAVHGIAVGTTRLMPIIETAAGVLNSRETLALAAHSSRVAAVIFGSVDLARDAGIDPSATGMELMYARSHIVLAARAAGISDIVDGPFTALADLEGLRADNVRSRALGYTGRVVIHPSQVEAVKQGYTLLSADQVGYLRTIVEKFEECIAQGRAAM